MSAAWRVAAALLVLFLAGSCATTGPASVPAELRKEYAPTGKLRVGLLATNPAYVTQGTPPGVQRGVAVDIGKELASRLGVPMEPVSYASSYELWQGARRGEWDVGMLAIDAERAADMNFTSAYLFASSYYIGLAVAKGRPAAYAHAYEFIEELKASGAVQDYVSREGLSGVRVAPARAK